MLGPWPSHDDYQQRVVAELAFFAKLNSYALWEYQNSLSKLYILNLDPLLPLIAPLYSTTGRPSTNQPEIFRSLILMNDLGFPLDKWIIKLAQNPVLKIACGFQGELPGIASYYDFINRIIKLDEKSRFKPKKRKPRDLYPNLIVDSFISDSASDNYATYQLLDSWGINAVIALNGKSKGNNARRQLRYCAVNDIEILHNIGCFYFHQQSLLSFFINYVITGRTLIGKLPPILFANYTSQFF